MTDLHTWTWRALAAAWSALLALAPLTAAAAPASASCTFQLGFAELATQIPDVVGACLESEQHAANGDALQVTVNGLLVWRKLDNFTAFTDGATTWVNGPFGIQARPNDQRFPWEAPGLRPTAPLALGQTWSEPGLDLTLDRFQVGTSGSAPVITLFYTMHNSSDRNLQVVVDHANGIDVVDNRGRHYPIACCAAEPATRTTLVPGQTIHGVAQYVGDASVSEVSALTVTFKRVGPILNAQWVIPLLT